MCLSFLGQIIYGALIFVAIGLTLTSMLTPGWRSFKTEIKKELDKLKPIGEIENIHNLKPRIPETMGIFPFLCRIPRAENAKHLPIDAENSADWSYCEQWWKGLKYWEQLVIVSMCLALITECFAVVWLVITLCACCCRKYLIHFLSIIPLLATIFLSVAIGFYVHYQNIDTITTDVEALPEAIQKSSEVGYSFYMACGALVMNVLAVFVGALSEKLSQCCL
ncbi:hypothetical protein AB6A40_010176 [Gnathostoma spinigerum]|uniref:Uncharacterized protein n=1 Tax=Gnathostoma spinigerum TaxID=75299 RepID=A0ABD6F282_9BILA